MYEEFKYTKYKRSSNLTSITIIIIGLISFQLLDIKIYLVLGGALFLVLIRLGFVRETLLIVAILILAKVLQIEVIQNSLKAFHLKIYSEFINYSQNFSPTTRDFLTALTIGYSESRINNNIIDLFKNNNLLFFLSVNGIDFELIKKTVLLFKYFINKRILIFLVIILQFLYLFLVGFQSISTIRVAIFSSITNYSIITGREISYFNKQFLCACILGSLSLVNLMNKGLLTSYAFSLTFLILNKKPLRRVFNTYLKKLSVLFIVTNIIFNTQKPDFLANIIFSLTYPIFFIGNLANFVLDIMGIKLLVTEKTLDILTYTTTNILRQIKTPILEQIQVLSLISIFLLILANIKYKNPIYEKFKQ